jgi:hypothetical protein
MLCIFCDQERAPSIEHVFPLAIGGTVTTDRVCAPCNSVLGSRVDAALSDFFPVRMRRAEQGPEFKSRRSDQLKRTWRIDPLPDHRVRSSDRTILLHGLFVAGSIIVALFNSTPANAAALRCASRHLVPAERDDVVNRANRVAPKGGGSLTLTGACSNHDFAIAWFRTPLVVDPDGVHWWWSVRCDRKTRSWSCSPAERVRRIEVDVQGNAQPPTTVVSSLPEGISADRAKAVVAATATLAMKPEIPLSACSKGRDDANTWLGVRSNPPAPDLEYPAASVYVTSNGVTVDYGWNLRVRFDQDDRAVCWELLISVD